MSATGISTHVLDTSRGQPAVGVPVILERDEAGDWVELARGVTDTDGRLSGLLPTGPPTAGDYRLRFLTAAYFARVGDAIFYPEVILQVRFTAPGGKYHLPLLLSPFGYSTYRGS